jgi:transcriptional regulator of arginine metabolism
MKKYTRQRIILDIIENLEIGTQEELAEHLLKKDIDITQATISRDIRELKLVKVLGSNGKYKYATMDSQKDGIDQRLNKVFKSTVLSIEKAINILVVKTLPGAAQICAMAIENLKNEDIAGIIAGNDTIFIAIKEGNSIDAVLLEIKELLK